MRSLLDVEIASRQLEDLLELNVSESELDPYLDKQSQKAYELMTFRYEASESFVALTQELWPILTKVDRHGVHNSDS